MDSIKNPLVSIVFTSYNHAEYLEQAIDSILAQHFQDFEFIIVDDCSTDRSVEILKGYGDLPNVKLHLLEKNTGSYVKASHYGALKATGKYILFAQCDDYAEPDQLSELVNAISNNDVGVVFSKSNLVDEDGKFISDDYSIRDKAFKVKCKSDTLLTGKEMRSFLSYACVIPNLSAALVKKELYFKVGGLPEKYLMAADWAFWLEMAESAAFYYIAKPLNNFRQHGTTIRSKTKIDRQLMEIYNVFQDHIHKYGLRGKPANDLMSGFGNIWFNYFLETPLVVSSSFLNILFKTSSKNKLMPYFLLKGVMKKIKAIVQK